jgi:hypothetical protein
MNPKKVLKIFIGTKPLFIHFSSLYIHSYTTHFIHNFVEFRSSFLIAVSSGRGPPQGADPRFELGAALQQPDMLPTEPRRTLSNEPRRTLQLSQAAP